MCPEKRYLTQLLAKGAALMGIVSDAYYTNLTNLTTLGMLAEVAAKFCEGSKCLTK